MIRSKYLVITMDVIIPSFIVLSIGFVIYLVLYSPFFAIQNISCQLDFEPCENEAILAELDKLKGQNIFTLDPSSTATILTSADFTLRSVEYKKALADSIHFSLHSVYPTVALSTGAQETKYVALDNQLRVIKGMDKDPNVPLLILMQSQTLVLGKRVEDPLLKSALESTITLYKELTEVESVTLKNDQSLYVALKNGKTAIFSLDKDLYVQIRTLQAILREVTINKAIKTIDVRFMQPVLR